jgi:hypothetical protein
MPSLDELRVISLSIQLGSPNSQFSMALSSNAAAGRFYVTTPRVGKWWCKGNPSL